jgi:hypothetical protein
MPQSKTARKKTKRVAAITLVGLVVYFFSSGRDAA